MRAEPLQASSKLAAVLGHLATTGERKCEKCGADMEPVDGLIIGFFCDPCVEAEKAAVAAQEKAEEEREAKAGRVARWRAAWGEESLYASATMGQALCPAAMQKLIQAAVSGQSVYIHGASGTGKSCALFLAGLAFMREHSRRPTYWNAIKLRHHIATLARSDDGSGRAAFMESMARKAVICVDDIGHMSASEAGGEALLEMTEERYATSSPIWLSSQYDLDAWAKRFSNAITGDAVVRRLAQICTVIEFKR